MGIEAVINAAVIWAAAPVCRRDSRRLMEIPDGTEGG